MVDYERLWQTANERAEDSEEKMKDYLAIIIAFMGLQTAVCWTLHKLMVLFNPIYDKMNISKKADYITRYLAIAHAFLSTFTSYLGIFHFCDKEGSTFINDLDCMSNPKNFH